MSPWSRKIVWTPNGIVVREFWASGECAWRRRSDGSWDHCGDHKGPWVTVDFRRVPQIVRNAVENYKGARDL